jgi:hypothetical protein
MGSSTTNPLSSVTRLLGGSSGAGGSSGTSALTEQLTSLTQQLQQLQSVNQTEIETMEENTSALSENTSSKGSGADSAASSAGSTIASVLGFGLGLSPLISGLVSLFGGGGSNQASPLVPYVAPPSVNATAGISSSQSGAFGVDIASGGLPRAQPSSSSSSTTQITVQVQAMDSQSFLDHSNDIAQAVRQAMLESTTLNDVIREV